MNEEQRIFNVEVLCCYKNFNFQHSKLNIQNSNYKCGVGLPIGDPELGKVAQQKF